MKHMARLIGNFGNLALIMGLLTLLSLLAMPRAKADPTLVTDISSHLISVTSDFTGTELLLFGTIQSPDAVDDFTHGDLIITVRGPRKDMMVRKKDRIAGIWMNSQSVEFEQVPSFYAIVSNRPVEEIAPANVLHRLRIGAQRLDFRTAKAKGDTLPFKEAVIRQRSKEDLYSDQEAAIQFLGDTLFRTNIALPANVPVGDYVAEFFLFRNGDLISAQSSPLFVKKSGLGRTVYDFAHNYSALYGISAIIIALLAGWIAAVIYRKD